MLYIKASELNLNTRAFPNYATYSAHYSILLCYRLPSTSQGYVWRLFQGLRNSDEIAFVWNVFVTQSSIVGDETQLLLQLLMDRFLKALIRNEGRRSSSVSNIAHSLNDREQNAARYMAGYIAVSLLKRYQHPTKKEHLQKKHGCFTHVLSMVAAKRSLFTRLGGAWLMA